ncbi:MAG: hypothetical protein M3Z31_18130 [Pseudomonadota bacterium]|nr:hypothetical protein [Pseudomonadota bacterium]
MADVDRSSMQRQLALSVWENEGGRGLSLGQALRSDVPYMMTTEITQLRIRIIALENLVVALLAAPSNRKLDLARELANYISPRSGFTPHHLTVSAAAQMMHLVERAGDMCAIRS